MKKYLAITFLIFETLFGQSIQVISNLPITDKTKGNFFYPRVMPNGEDILLTSENYDGIWFYNTKNSQIEKIIDAPGAGYEPMTSFDGNEIIFRKNEFQNNRKYSSLHMYNIRTRITEIIEEKSRSVSPPLSKISNTISYTIRNQLIEKNVSDPLQKSITQTLITIENSDLVLYSNGERIIFNPLGKGNYLWPSISPDGTKILFTLAGKGSFISDLDGNIISELGRAHYPNWSYDSEWIVYMDDYDDGYNVTSSDLHVVSADGTSNFNITATENVHEMYPTWSPAGNEIVYNTSEGVIYKLKLKID